MITEGRDQGSVVFPDADVKIYLDAAVDERVRRRSKDIAGADRDRVRREIDARDESDRNRDVSPLVKPEGATVVDTTGLTIEQVVEKICEIVVRD